MIEIDFHVFAELNITLHMETGQARSRFIRHWYMRLMVVLKGDKVYNYPTIQDTVAGSVVLLYI